MKAVIRRGKGEVAVSGQRLDAVRAAAGSGATRARRGRVVAIVIAGDITIWNAAAILILETAFSIGKAGIPGLCTRVRIFITSFITSAKQSIIWARRIRIYPLTWC